MGVTTHHCMLCALPTQLAQYVPAGDPVSPRMLRIVRGAHSSESSEGIRGGFGFDERHAWLADPVVVASASSLDRDEDGVVRASISDGELAGHPDVELDDDDDGREAVLYHHACWERLGSPRTLADTRSTKGTHAHAMLEVYQGQLFHFGELAIDGRAWMLEDPATNARSAARLDALVEIARGRPDTDAFTVAQRIEAGRGWTGFSTHDETRGRRSVVRSRRAQDATDRADYPDCVLARKMYAPSPRIDPAHEALELALMRACEEDAAAIMVAVRYLPNEVGYLFYAKDGEATCERIERVPGLDDGSEAMLGPTPDPNWELQRRLTGR